MTDVSAQSANQTSKDLRQLEQQRVQRQQKARNLEAAAAKLERLSKQEARRITQAAQQIRAQERALLQTDNQIAQLEKDTSVALQDLEHRRGELALALSALAGIAKIPPIANSFRPDDGQNARLAATALAGLEPALANAMADLARQVDHLQTLHQGLAIARKRQTDQLIALKSGRDKLRADLYKHRAAVKSTTNRAVRERRKVKSLAKQAKTLNDLMRRLEPVKPASIAARTTGPGLKALKGRLPLPVTGNVIAKFGKQSQGVTISTRDNAMVTVPTDGKVVFSETFRSYGRLLIIDLGGGYHLLVAGMATSGVVVGQWLLAGEPVGWMEKKRKTTTPSLYIELRYNGKPIDPLPWLAANKRKVSG